MVKTRLAGIIFCSVLATTGWAATPSPSLIATPPQPMWSELSVQQKIVLAPLSDDWDSLESYRQKKWLGIVARFSKIAPEEQHRIQEQMQEWGKLTPEERQLARENFKAANKLSTEDKQKFKKKWAEYVNLPDDEKEKFKQQSTSKPVPKPGRPAASAPPLLPVPAALAVPAVTPTAPTLPAAADATPPVATVADKTTKP